MKALYLVDVLSAGGAPHVAGRHHSDDEGGVPLALYLGHLRWVEVGWVVLVQHFPLRHPADWGLSEITQLT